MSSKDANDPKMGDKGASSSTSSQPQKLFRPSIDEESIPWGEIIFEEKQEHPLALEPHATEISSGTGFFSRIFGIQSDNPLDEQVVGPPLAVLAVVLLVFLVLAGT
jgi:hypothetical protein